MEQKQLVNRYIGVSGGYLGEFSYRTHSDFYPEYCDLDINPNEIQGTTRVRFETILERASPEVQAKIVRGILKKCPPIPGHEFRTQERHDEFLRVAQRLESASTVSGPAPVITSAIVEHTIADAETLIKTRGATSGVDRIHTMLHGYMRAVCDDEGIAYTKDDTIGALFRAIRERHPRFAASGPRAHDITQICRAFGSVMDVLNPIRNNASPAHPNKELLAEPEAMLVINGAKTLLHYVDAKLALAT
jgi:hypothetical protein